VIGQTIAQYRILEKLGQGDMGMVYLAEDTTLDQKVALKLLLPTAAQRDEITHRRLLREASSAATSMKSEKKKANLSSPWSMCRVIPWPRNPPAPSQPLLTCHITTGSEAPSPHLFHRPKLPTADSCRHVSPPAATPGASHSLHAASQPASKSRTCECESKNFRLEDVES